MPLKLQFTPKTIGAVALAVLVLVLWKALSPPSPPYCTEQLTSNCTVKLNTEVKVELTPNSEVLGLHVTSQATRFMQALDEAKFIFKAPSDGTYSATLKNANVEDVHDIDLYGYDDDKVPVPSPNFEYEDTVGNFLLSTGGLGYSNSQANEYGEFKLRKNQKVVIIAFPWSVVSRPTNVSLLVNKI